MKSNYTIFLILLMVPLVFAAPLEQKTEGDINAPITIEVFANYQEFFVANWYENVFPLLKENYADTGDIKIVFRHFPGPVVVPFYEDAIHAAKATECAAYQNDFFSLLPIVLENQDNLKKEDLLVYAEQAYLNVEFFEICMHQESTEALVRADIEEGKQRGVAKTPAFFLNGEPIEAYTYESFEEIIENEG